jgi:tRNA (mo5U34)-methyltransferase
VWNGREFTPYAVTPTPEAATAFIEREKFTWHQRFELAPGVWTPGVSPVRWLCDVAKIPEDLSGLTALDVGTTNAGTAFELERRGAARVVAIDIYDSDWFGVGALTKFLESRVEYVRASVYELRQRFPERFDVVIFWGVLYHLRHPLLALDNLRSVAGRDISLESAVCDSELPLGEREQALVRFYRRDELGGDPSNWFVPTVAALEDWCRSAGFDVERMDVWPKPVPARAMLRLLPTNGTPEYEELSYERPLRCEVM